MPIPDFQSLMLPVLRTFSDGEELRLLRVREIVAISEELTDDQVRELLPSGRQTKFANRIYWAAFHINRAGLVRRLRPGLYQITKEGKQLLAEKPTRIDLKFLRRYPAFVAWKSTYETKEDKPTEDGGMTGNSDTPDEILDHANQQLRATLESQVLDMVRSAEPSFFEKIVVDLLVAMGYGGGDPTMGSVTPRSGDGGIDGIVKQDRLGLDHVSIQAKKYAEGNTVGVNSLRNFVGAIDSAGTSKGVFVTTSTFTSGAEKHARRSQKQIVLIDGKELARLMVEFNVGVRLQHAYEIKEIDKDYFEN